MSAYEHLVERAGDAVVRPGAVTSRAHCPAHNDQTPSLDLKAGDGCALVRCRADCETADVMAAWDLPMAALYDDYWTSSNGSSPDAPPETFDYVDEHGQLLYRAVRLRGKRFRQQAPDGTWSVKGIRKVPYRLPHVVAATERGETVWIAEGEKDVRTLERLGLVATTNVAGAGKWTGELSEYLRGADVVVVGDCDAAGRNHVAKVAASLRGVAISVRVVELDRDREDGYDVSDLVCEPNVDDARERLERLAEQPTEPQGSAPMLQRRPLRLERLRPTPLAWGNRLVGGAMNLKVGEEGVGKGAIGAYIVAQATNGGLDGFLSGVECRVAHVGDEDDFDSEQGARYYAAGAATGRIEQIAHSDDSMLDLQRDAPKLERLLKSGPFELIVFEALLDNLPALKNPYDPHAIRASLRPIRAVLRRLGTIGLGDLHTGKIETKNFRAKVSGSHQYNALSSSSLFVGVHPEDDSRRVLLRGKGNYARPPAPLAFRLEGRQFELNGHPFDVVRAVDVEEIEGVSLEDAVSGTSQASGGVMHDLAMEILAGFRGVQRQADIARALGRDPRDQSVRRALRWLEQKGHLEQRSDRTWKRVSSVNPLRGVTPDTPLEGTVRELFPDATDDPEQGA